MAAQNRLVDENTQMRRSMLDLQQQIESLRGELARAGYRRAVRPG